MTDAQGVVTEEVGFKKLSMGMQTVVTLIVIIGAVVPLVLGFVNFDKRLDMSEDSQKIHIQRDDRFREKISDDIDSLESDVHSLELVDKELEIKYAEILRRLEKQELNDNRIIEKLDHLVRADV
jgi:uncharacterized membrane protein